jgi:hypothetical protein
MFLHFHDGQPVEYEDDEECPVCAPILAADPGAIITDAVEGVKIDG